MSPHLLEETKVPVPCEDKDARSGPLICPPGDWYSRVPPALLAKLTQALGPLLKQGRQLAIADKPHRSSTPTTRSRPCSRPGRSQHGLQGSCSTSATQLPEAARPNAVPSEPLFFFHSSLYQNPTTPAGRQAFARPLVGPPQYSFCFECSRLGSYVSITTSSELSSKLQAPS